MSKETLGDFISRGGRIKKLETIEKKPCTTSRYRHSEKEEWRDYSSFVRKSGTGVLTELTMKRKK